MIVQWLPEGSALHASLQGGPEFRPWTLPNLIAAGQLNALNGANWQRAGGKGKRPPALEPPTPKVAGRGGARADRARRSKRKPGGLAAWARTAATHKAQLPPSTEQRQLPPGPSAGPGAVPQD